MAQGGPILILEEDREDKEVLEQAFLNLEVKNKRMYFDDGKEMLQYLETTLEKPFLLLSNVKISGMDGFELREIIQQNEKLRKKGIPFIFLSLDARKEVVEKAYELTVQGFFEKEDTIAGVEQQLKMVIEYWRQCRHPNN